MYENYFFSCLEEKNSNTCTSGGRFSLYTEIKHSYHSEKYLLLDNKIRRLITSLRISTHNLPIEHLRKSNIDRDKRFCHCCNGNLLGSEFHVLFECNNQDLVTQRNILHDKISQLCSQWKNLRPRNQFIYLLRAHDESINFLFAIFLEKVFRIVKKLY